MRYLTLVSTSIRHACLSLATSLGEKSYLVPFQCVLIALFLDHTPNFAWNHAIWPYERLLDQSHIELFSQTLIPSFRPFLHLEKLFGDLLGFKGIYAINQVTYAAFVWLIADLIRKNMPSQQLQKRGLAARLILLLPYTVLPFYFAIASPRTIADPIYAYGIMSMIFFFIFLERKNNQDVFKGPSMINLYAWAAGAIIVVDLSRPYGIVAVAIFMI